MSKSAISESSAAVREMAVVPAAQPVAAVQQVEAGNLLAEIVAELKKANEKLEAVEKATKAAESKLSEELKKVNEKLEVIQSKATFIEARSDTFTAHSHDWRRHRVQMKSEIVQAKTYEEKKESKQQYVQWRRATFWMIYQNSAVRALGFWLEDVCSS